MVKSNYSSPKVFKFEDEASGRYWYVRVSGTSEMPEWVCSDVLAILYPEVKPEDYPDHFSHIPAPWKSQKQMLTADGEQLVSTLYEPGLYYVIAKSNSPLIVTFQQWISQEILPVIRPSGSYSIVRSAISALPSTQDKLEAIRLGMNLLYELGGVDEYMRLVLRERVREILLDSSVLEGEGSKKNGHLNANHFAKLPESLVAITHNEHHSRDNQSNGELPSNP